MSRNLSPAETLGPFSLRFSEIPSTSFGICKMLKSLILPHLFYVERSKNRLRHVHEDNSGHGSEFTDPIPRRHLTVIAYVHGFTDVTWKTFVVIRSGCAESDVSEKKRCTTQTG